MGDLAQLGDIAWEKLSTAAGGVGSAADIPDLVRRIATSEREPALAALEILRDKVWREGALAEATPYIVPALLELIALPAVMVRPPIIQLLAFLYSADAPTVIGLAQADEATRASRETQAKLTIESTWVQSTRGQVRRGLAQYIALVADEDRDVRIAAACLLVGFRDRDAEVEVRRVLSRRVFDEPDEVVRANVVACLNVYLPSVHLEVYDTLLEKDDSLLVRREAAHSLAAVERELTPPHVVAVLLEAIMNVATLGPLYTGVAWNRRGLVADTCWALTRLGRAARGYLRYLEKLIMRAHPEDGLAMAEAALFIAFGEPAAGRSLAELAPEQTSLLRGLTAADAIWGRELTQMLAHYGLPREQDALKAFLLQS